MERIFRPKLFSLLRKGFNRDQFITDVFSGIIVGVVALPLAIAFAVASGVSPERGLITAIIAGFLISLLGGSRVQIGGPTGAFIVIVLGIVQQHGLNGLLISTILAGVMLTAFGLLRLGSLLKYIPHPMIIGFTSAIALIIFTSQIRDAFGLQTNELPAAFLGKWKIFLLNARTASLPATVTTLSTIALIILFKRITTRIPSTFIAIVLVSLAVYFFRIPVLTIGDSFGEIPRTLIPVLPEFSGIQFTEYLSPALTIALLGAIESLLSAVVADGMIGSNHRSNTELIAQGIANIVTPFFGGIPATGAIARTATNIRNGGRTPVAGIMHAVTLLLILLFLGQWATLIPMPCLAGILLVVAVNMSEWRSFISTFRGSVFDILILLTTFFLTILVDLSVAIQVGIVLSALLFMRRMADVSEKIADGADSDVIEHYDFPEGIQVFEISGPFFFASAKTYAEALRQTGMRSEIIIIRMRHVPFMDATGSENFRSALRDMMNQGIVPILSGVNKTVKRELDRRKITSLIGEHHIFSSFDTAIRFALARKSV